MKGFAALSSDPGCRAVAAALIHFLWQGALTAFLLAAANRALRGASARARYAAACAAMALLLAFPVLTLARLRPREATAAAPSSISIAAGPPAASLSAGRPLPTAAATDRLAMLAPWIVLGWVAGVSLLSLRLLGGHLTARRLRHRADRAGEPWEGRFAGLAARLSVARPVRLLESALVEVPTAIGVLRPVVLVPAGILTGMAPDRLDSLLAHELAHIRRGDALANLLQALAETLLFYHPATWWISSRIRIERENACDDLAVEATGDPAAYARALVDLAELAGRRAHAPALAVAADGGRLWDRVVRLLPAPDAPRSASPSWLATAVALGGVLALGAVTQYPATQTPPSAPMEAAAESKDAPPSPVAPGPSSSPDPQPAATPAPAPRRGSGAEPPPPNREGRPARPLLTPEQLIAFRIHGVTPEFVGEVLALGYSKASPDELVALRIHGVTPEYIREMTAIFGKLPLEKYTELRIHGLTPEAGGELKRLFGSLDVEDALACRIHGVDGAFVKAFRDAGYASLSADEAVSLRIHGAAPGDAAAWKSLGYGNPPVDELLALRIHGATPEFARAIRAQGLKDATLDDLTAFRIHGVTPEFVRDVRALGYTSLAAEDFTAFRIHGISVESIREMNRRAGEMLSADDLVDWRLGERRRSHKEE